MPTCSKTNLLHECLAHIFENSQEVSPVISNRLKAGILPVVLFLVPIFLILFSSVREAVGSPVFWAGFVGFALAGTFLFLPEDAIPGKRKRRKGRVGYLSLTAVMLALILVNNSYPSALFLGLGAVGFSAGLGFRVSYYLLFQSKWDYCARCEKKVWIVKSGGKWYCNLKGHVVDSYPSQRPSELPPKAN
jgi:hypothetical protein